MIPRVAIVGRSNVGKSTLVNRLDQARASIVGPTPELTRDRLDREIQWRGRRFIFSDTGGLVQAKSRKKDSIAEAVAKVAIDAVRSADLVLFVCDASSGLTSEDLELRKLLRGAQGPVLVIANKADYPGAANRIHEFQALGFGPAIEVSALHGTGSGDLLDVIHGLLPERARETETEDSLVSVSFAGRPNVGKSSLFNRIVGQARSIVHEKPGTTRDSVDLVADAGGVTYRFIDTAGVRRHAKTHGVEVFSATRTRAAIERSDLVVLVVDSAEGVTATDQRIAKEIAESGAGAIVALNKWDLVKDEYTQAKAMESFARGLRFLDHAPYVRISALTGRGVDKLVEKFAIVLEARQTRVSTGVLNKIVTECQQINPPSRSGNRSVKIMYATQTSNGPPAFLLFATGPLEDQWLRFLENRMRAAFDFSGNPLRFVVRDRTFERRGGRSVHAG